MTNFNFFTQWKTYYSHSVIPTTTAIGNKYTILKVHPVRISILTLIPNGHGTHLSTDSTSDAISNLCVKISAWYQSSD